MIFETPKLTERDIQVIEVLEVTKNNLGSALRTPKRWTGLLRRNLMAKAIQGSNTIEGYNATFEEAVAIVEGEATEDTHLETRLALFGYQAALTYIIRLSDDQHARFNEELVRCLHYMMLSYDPTKSPGQWRPGPIFVRHEPSAEIVYEGPDGDLVPGLMREFVTDVQRTDSGIPNVIKAAMAHLNLVMIHPFSDGNGRMGRAVQTYVLARDGTLASPFSSIEEYLGSKRNTEDYYAVLKEVGKGTWCPDGDARPWISFCLKAHLQQALTVKRRVIETARLWDELETELRKRKLPERMVYAIYEAASLIRVRSARYRMQTEVSVQVASRDLHTLVEQNLLLPKGERRGRSYVASPFLLEIRQRTREPRVSAEEAFKDQLNLRF